MAAAKAKDEGSFGFRSLLPFSTLITSVSFSSIIFIFLCCVLLFSLCMRVISVLFMFVYICFLYSPVSIFFFLWLLLCISLFFTRLCVYLFSLCLWLCITVFFMPLCLPVFSIFVCVELFSLCMGVLTGFLNVCVYNCFLNDIVPFFSFYLGANMPVYT